MQNSPQAVAWYLKGIDYGEEHLDEIDRRVLASIYAQLGKTFALQKNYPESLAIGKKEYATRQDSASLADLAVAYAHCSMNDSASICYGRLLRSCLVAGHKKRKVQAMVGQALNFYVKMNNRAMADTCMRFLNKCQPQSLFSNAKVGKGRYHLRYGDRDSTAFYWQLVYDNPLDIHIWVDASRHLFEYYDARGDLSKACAYARSYVKLQDSIATVLAVRQTANVYNMYRYQRDLEAEGRRARE